METRCQERCEDCPARFVCRCLQVTEEAVVAAVTTLGVRSVQELKARTGAGDGCTCCHRALRQLIEAHAPEMRIPLYAGYAQSSSSPEPICS